ncbi:hypothetical protein BJY21_002009 [Kineosphaera limosa]|uniref:type IV toxin-antitoxin system AbiEi family antitoxin n=1 Tax=Kineosphaera limosa TaxID=111564 RepID=UPI00058EAF8F|nr:type IV toxin-antitoxin system AbiEi family antitoxin [Kineosphaera limosa]NYE00825.1 hypothetical protein [Kineosphaera limosa]
MLSGTATAQALPGDALETLAEHGVTALRHGSDLVTLQAEGVRHDFVLAHYTGAGMPPAALLDHARSAGLPVLLALASTSSRLAKTLAEENLHWVDLAGNASIRVPGLRVAIQGRPPVTVPSRYVVSAAFRPAGLQVLLAVLVMSQDRIPKLRSLADAAGVSLGAAQAAVADLRRHGYVDGDQLTRTGELLDRWVAAYGTHDSDRWIVGTYEGEPEWWTDAEAFRTDAACLGGEAAADAMGLPLRSLTGIVYSDDLPTRVIRFGRLRRANSGNVQLRHKFWSLPDEGWLAPSPLIYAELLKSGDGRRAEIAQEMRESDAILRSLRD